MEISLQRGNSLVARCRLCFQGRHALVTIRNRIRRPTRVIKGYYRWQCQGRFTPGIFPDPDLAQADVNRISGASGIVADDKGTIYAADVGPHRLRKYVKIK